MLTSFPLDGLVAHGGVLRSKQVADLGIKSNYIVLSAPASSFVVKSIHKYTRSWFPALYTASKLAPYLSISGLIKAYLLAVYLHGICKKYSPGAIHVETSIGISILIARLSELYGYPVSIYPQNVEFMVPSQLSSLFRSKMSALAFELQLYKASTHVFTISNFDSAVLQCFDIKNVQTIAYEPVGEHLDWLRQVKEARAVSSKNDYLILGSIENAPTKTGIVELLELIRSSTFSTTYKLAGNRTEALAHLAPDNVEVLGSVSSESLRQIMIRSKGLVVKQPPTTGILTRAVDALYAGLPVYIFAGYLQAYSLKGKNVYVISSLNELP